MVPSLSYVTRFVNRGFHNHLNSLLPTSIQWQIQEAAMVSAETHIERVHFCSENGHEVWIVWVFRSFATFFGWDSPQQLVISCYCLVFDLSWLVLFFKAEIPLKICYHCDIRMTFASQALSKEIILSNHPLVFSINTKFYMNTVHFQCQG